MANKKKSHSPSVLSQASQIGITLHEVFKSNKDSSFNLKNLSTSTGLSINSIKSIFRGATANIASYISLANALNCNISLNTEGTACGSCNGDTAEVSVTTIQTHRDSPASLLGKIDFS